MDHNLHKSKKITDIVSAKSDAERPHGRQLLIPSRPIMGNGRSDDTDDTADKPDGIKLTATLAAHEPSKRTVIVPIDADETNEPAKESEQSAAEAEAATTDKNPGAEPIDSTPANETAMPAPAPGSEASPTDIAAPSEQPAPVDTTSAGPTADTQKAVEAATQAAKRQQELESYIDSREYFVPINVAARKRSIKVSIGLTIVVAALGAVLIDLMLDSGAILLVQKIPHTHFFNVNIGSNDQ